MYSFYMKDILLPVAPSKLTLKVKNNNKTLDLMNLGEINILKKEGLTDISFTVLLPSRRYPFSVYENGFKEPSFYLGHFEKLKVEKKPFRFIVSRLSPAGELLFDTNILVSMESYEITESAENGSDIMVSIDLKQYRPYATEILNVVTTPQQEKIIMSVEIQRPSKEPAKSYTVKAGDSLWSICKRELGDGNQYKSVAGLNGIKNPSLIRVGQVLRLG
ncbi:LysM peptidoglycan-binding domain-containing protein [Thermotalea metallivorans]|uniref:LysM domain-containing protein n=1 Tax=Thermotalea metallivorans TaxID=520762 RepID=A0A140LCL7_9FIRM|nr:LysM domain-containing protein [Thermotalea metallivorans]KXG78292.1 hypothetical protein AN619_02670 [Thermotalea metallivorans]